MTIEQLEKRVGMLEAQRREAEKELAQLQKRVAGYEDALEANQALIEQFRKETAKLADSAKEVGQFEKEFNRGQAEAAKELKNAGDDIRKEFKKQVKEFEDILTAEQARLEKELLKLREEFGVTGTLQKELKAQGAQDEELSKRIDEVNDNLEDVIRGEEQRKQLADALEDTRKRVDKQVATAMGDVAAANDRTEKASEKVKKFEADLQKMQKQFERMLHQAEVRSKEQNEFKEKYAAEQVDRQRIWEEWEKRFKTIEQQSEDIATRLKDIETIDLAVRRAQGSFDELVEKINRRVNELTEVQRLGEQRFRQEWSTFQADSQKRWSGYILEREEQQKEAARQREQLADQVTRIEDTLQDLQDVVQHVSEQTESFFQTMLEAMRDSLAENERFYGSMR
jgi:chromosome segregation ATPase